MSYSIFPTHRFAKEIKRLSKKFPSVKGEFKNLISDLLTNPELGTFLGNNCYKIRLAIGRKRKGKSGGARVITYLYLENKIIYLLTIYDKGEKQDLKPNELKKMIDGLDLNN